MLQYLLKIKCDRDNALQEYYGKVLFFVHTTLRGDARITAILRVFRGVRYQGAFPSWRTTTGDKLVAVDVLEVENMVGLLRPKANDSLRFIIWPGAVPDRDITLGNIHRLN